MGAHMSRDKAKHRSKKIDSNLKKDWKKENEIVKLLLLGAGDSGKTTIVKQMKILHCGGYTENDKIYFKDIIQKNIVEIIVQILEGMKKLDIEFTDENLVQCSDEVQNFRRSTGNATEILEIITKLWTDDSFQRCYARNKEYEILDSSSYFLPHLERCLSCDYIPTPEDILRARVRTTGIVQSKFQYKERTFALFDVGGQRSERKKWIHCFEDTTAILFVASLAEYDMVLYEDATQNRMVESLQLFQNMVNNRFFIRLPFILFLNKKDILAIKIKTIPVKTYFPEFGMENNYDNACEFITDKYMRLNKSTRHSIYPHLTCATSTENIKFVFDAVVDIILEKLVASCYMV